MTPWAIALCSLALVGSAMAKEPLAFDPSHTLAVPRPLLMERLKSISTHISHPKPQVSIDLDRLAYAVARHETGNCTARVGSALVNNCFGIMHWPNGKRQFRPFRTKAESYKAFKTLWVRVYGGRIPTLADARKYSGNDRAKTWRGNVLHFYETAPVEVVEKIREDTSTL